MAPIDARAQWFKAMLERLASASPECKHRGARSLPIFDALSRHLDAETSSA
jgi:hypothetical protein